MLQLNSVCCALLPKIDSTSACATNSTSTAKGGMALDCDNLAFAGNLANIQMNNQHVGGL
jgi:hypothetical protein